MLEKSIADILKTTYKYVNDKMYERRFALFCEDLKCIEIYFQPILYFDKNNMANINIESWEALARDSCTQNTPVALFETAELWGVRFQVELDLYCIRSALKKYHAF